MLQPDPTRPIQKRGFASFLGLPILVAVATCVATAFLAPSLGAAHLGCWRIHARLPLSEASRYCLLERPIARAWRYDVYEPIAPVRWVRAFVNTPAALTPYRRMSPASKAQLRGALTWVALTWAAWVCSVVAVFLAALVAFAMYCKAKPQRVQIYGTRFFAEPEEVLASGLVVGYTPPLRTRVLRAIRTWFSG